ncbi:hypothetical protein BLA24_05455 [Streptomyces cinnamoneus]|uniref:Uncharacterized protein n=1 Tax=Streptomyces cinnamoneus TaxID=53446 RepID=A0A2G1XNG6_STRCJ|nr:maleylpyruvate isomerase family mycothiol-dependent enzyme [Streptomyces cinnamoneus]PHQ52721.1 hypothetical protein BLA24_05455 [Streptomyces cinnamoneus]PPT11815.1 maleylpyruvate isomerase family mycothiol-dependent enzyme [Streptomyces cinnamoneus]
MTPLSFERYCAEILTQTDLLRSHAQGADPQLPVPTCPGWNLSQLLWHVGGAHRWVETIVRTRAQGPVPDDLVNDQGHTDEDPDALDTWLAEGSAALARALRAAGPGTAVWTVVPDEPLLFWARRMTHETVVHRADAALTVGAEYAVEGDVASDALDEWMRFSTMPEAYAPRPGEPALLGPGRTLHFRATDTPPEARGDWLVDLTGEAPAWHRAPGEAAVTLRGPLTDLLLHVYGRPPATGSLDIDGDGGLLDLWRRRAGFWLEE